MKGALDTIDKLHVIVQAFVCTIFIKFFSLLDIRRKCSINKNLECPLVCTDIYMINYINLTINNIRSCVSCAVDLS